MSTSDVIVMRSSGSSSKKATYEGYLPKLEVSLDKTTTGRSSC